MVMKVLNVMMMVSMIVLVAVLANKPSFSNISLCRGLFFQSTMDQIQHLSDPPGVQSPNNTSDPR
jgi:hypothetical protein